MKKVRNFFGIENHPITGRVSHEIVAKPAASVENKQASFEGETDQAFERPRVVGFLPHLQGISVTRRGRQEIIFPHCEHKAQCYKKKKNSNH